MKITCHRCNIRLTVDESLRGREVRCPTCEYVFQAEDDQNEAESVPHVIPEPGLMVEQPTFPTAEVGETDQVEQLWYLGIPEGREFGPVTRQVLDSWVREGRISHACRLRNSSTEAWRLATADYPMLDEGSPFASPGVAKQLKPHRGQLVFGLAVLGCVIPFLSLLPAVFGTRDLRQMNAGKMDTRGDAMTRAGQAIAMVASMIWAGAFAVLLLVMLIRMMGRI